MQNPTERLFTELHSIKNYLQDYTTVSTERQYKHTKIGAENLSITPNPINKKLIKIGSKRQNNEIKFFGVLKGPNASKILFYTSITG
jgi:hypothetical protein